MTIGQLIKRAQRIYAMITLKFDFVFLLVLLLHQSYISNSYG